MRPITTAVVGLGEGQHHLDALAAVEGAIAAALEGVVPEPEGFVGQFHDIHRALHEAAPARATPADARSALVLVTAIHRSAQEVRVVPLELPPGHALRDSWVPNQDGVPRGLAPR